jgi:hypothetical protein
MKTLCLILIAVWGLLAPPSARAASSSHSSPVKFPPALETYADSQFRTVGEVLAHRVRVEPFNLIATLVFLGAVAHTLLAHQFVRWSHAVERKHRSDPRAVRSGNPKTLEASSDQSCAAARVLHFLGEVEAIFGIWVIPLCLLMAARIGWMGTLNYLEKGVGGYSEPVFVVAIMVIAATRPILGLAERSLRFVANLGGGRPAAWWLSILILGPILGSLITEPAAMTIAALLLAQRFYALRPSLRLAYATLGVLFVNISVGGVLTHFAAPPILMVAAPWSWDTPYMFRHFGWIALVGIVLAALAYYGALRTSFGELKAVAVRDGVVDDNTPQPVPAWVTVGHLLFMAWVVWSAHHSVLVIGGFLFFLAFFEVTKEFQNELQLRGAILVGFFLAGLVIHGGLQQWWIAPVLSRLKETPLMLAAMGLTAFNDNAAVTYLSTLVPDLGERLKHAAVAGAVTGGGLTVIANAPNPAGQSILGKFFPEGIAPAGLFLGALPATVILALCFLILG